MKKSLFSLLVMSLMCFVAGHAAQKGGIIASTEGSITFTVDENLPAPERHLKTYNCDRIQSLLLSDHQISKEQEQFLALSFDQEQMAYLGKGIFFRCLVEAYATHRPLTLSPDMVWLLISQGFSSYVNAHSEELRDRIVSHSGKVDIVVQSDYDLLAGKADYEKILNDFSKEIGKNTKQEIAGIVTAGFSTTGVNERIASQITLMETVKSYFEYTVMYMACGIPSITLEGTPADWQQVLDKTRQLERYGLSAWVKELEPILREFVRASQGQPRQNFWQGIVKKKRVDELRGGACSPENPTQLDGWFLTFFPDENGSTPKQVSWLDKMQPEIKRVPFKYLRINPFDGSVIDETPMEMWAGFVGIREDSLTYGLRPHIGWLIRRSDPEEESLDRLRQQEKNNGEIRLRINEVPQALAKLPHIRTLILQFTGPVVLPEWMDHMQIDRLVVQGRIYEEELADIKKRFPEAEIIRENALERPKQLR